MMRLATIVLLLTVAAALAEDKKPEKAAPTAQVVVTAEIACLHCTFGEGERCAVCLKLDDKTPIVLSGKSAKQFEDIRLSKKVVVVEGALSRNKDKRLVLTSDVGRLWTDQDKGKAPEKGDLRVVGLAVCARCDLALCDECTLAIKNGAEPIVLDGKLAAQHAEDGKDGKTATILGKLSIDKRGLLRLDAKKVEFKK